MADIIIGGGLLLTTLSTNIISKTVNTSIDLMSWLLTTGDITYNNITNKLKELDIENKLTIIKTLCLEYHDKITDQPNSLSISYKSLDDIIVKINIVLYNLKKKIEDHLQLYFKNWRNINCDNEIKELEILNNVLDQRFNIFLSIVKLN
jgi:hypothetical protein